MNDLETEVALAAKLCLIEAQDESRGEWLFGVNDDSLTLDGDEENLYLERYDSDIETTVRYEIEVTVSLKQVP